MSSGSKRGGVPRTNFEQLQQKAALEFEKKFQKQLSLYHITKQTENSFGELGDCTGTKLDRYL